MTGILVAAAIVGGVGLFIGVFLGVSQKQFAVEVDEREEAITGVLPGNNCVYKQQKYGNFNRKINYFWTFC